MPSGSKIKVSVALTKTLVERLDQVRVPLGESRSGLIERLVLDGLDQVELTARATTDPVLMGAFARALGEPGVLRSLLDSLKADLTDEQLELFARQMDGLSGKGDAHTLSPPPPLRQKKGGGGRSKPRGK